MFRKLGTLFQRAVLLLAIFALPACEQLGGGAAEQSLTAEEHAERADVMRDLSDLPAAIRAARFAVREAPSVNEYRWKLSTLQMENGEFEAAEATLRRMQQLEMTHPDMRLRLAKLMYQTLRFDDLLALDVASTPDGVVGSGEAAGIFYLQGRALNQLGDKPIEARNSFIKAYREFERARAAASLGTEALALQREMWVLQSSDEAMQSAVEHANCLGTAHEGRIKQFKIPERPNARVWRVGIGQKYKLPSEVVGLVKAGDIVEIVAGEYADSAVWAKPNLILRSAGGKVILNPPANSFKAGGDGQAAIWRLKGDGIIVNELHFSGARKSGTGVGLQIDGSNAVIRRSHFTDNDIGLASKGGANSELLLEFNEFGQNGAGDGFTHNVFVGPEKRLTFRYNYSYQANGGHLLKTRATLNDIRYNRFSDEAEDLTAYLIDIADGGKGYVIGNVLMQSYNPRDEVFVAYASDDYKSPGELFVINNSVWNQSMRGILVRNFADIRAEIINNAFFGTGGELLEGDGVIRGNEVTSLPQLRDLESEDLVPMPRSPLVDAGVRVGSLADVSLIPSAEYSHPAGGRTRPKAWIMDVGAYEFCGL